MRAQSLLHAGGGRSTTDAPAVNAGLFAVAAQVYFPIFKYMTTGESVMRLIKKKAIALHAAIIFGGFTLTSAAALAGTYEVTDGSDGNGAGTLRAALASGDEVINISVDIEPIGSTLSYEGMAPLEIVGNGRTIASSEDITLLEVTEGADLTISNLTFSGPGGYDVDNQGGGKGIFVEVPIEREGLVSLILTDVTVEDVGDHGVHVSDCDLEGCGAGGGGGGNGSAASVYARLENVTIDGVGYGGFDADGLRIDERGPGDILLEAIGSTFENVGADGAELDEGDNGNVYVDVRESGFFSNGGYCAGIPDEDIPDEETPTPGTADDRCLEWDDGEYVLDLDDGFDIDEAGNGNIVVAIVDALVNSNVDEGLDFDEEGQGNVIMDLVSVMADDNGDETIKVDEENQGNINAYLSDVTVTNGGDDGIQLESADAGQLHAHMQDIVATGNKKYGLKMIADKGWLKLSGDNDLSANADGEVDLEGGVVLK
jgi:hypothetical protein